MRLAAVQYSNFLYISLFSIKQQLRAIMLHQTQDLYSTLSRSDVLEFPKYKLAKELVYRL